VSGSFDRRTVAPGFRTKTLVVFNRQIHVRVESFPPRQAAERDMSMPVPLPPLPWLERANRLATIARLLSDTVHEVNNVLQVISGQAELLQSLAGAGAVVQERASSIAGNALRASAMLTELLTFARDAGDRSERVLLSQIAERAIGLRRYSLNRLRVDVAVDASSAGACVAGSPRILLQIVLNLVFNAEQALTGRSPGTLRLRTREDAVTAELIVEDSGPGVPERALEFVPDAMLASGRLGIGLQVARWLAEQQGGRLSWTTSEQGGGGCATLSLPAFGSLKSEV
jgi:signal transduction histidine kinase